MSFQSYSFFVFLAVTLAVVLFLARRGPRWAVPALGLASLVSYVAGAGIPGLFVLLCGTAVSGLAVRWSCAPGRSIKERKRILLLAAGYQIVVLLVFKYTGFLTGGAVTVGWVPLGLSFFTFQQLWMLKETWSGNFRPASWTELVLFSFFFPTVTSGPILKAGDFFSQLRGEHFLHPTWQDAAAGLYAIAVGTMKKVLLAEGDGGSGAASAGPEALDQHPAGAAALRCGCPGSGPAAQHDPEDGGLPAHGLEGGPPDPGGGLVCAVLQRDLHLHLFQFLRRQA